MSSRRWIVGLSLLGAAIGGIVSIYQMGMVRRLPSIPGELFDANKVDASDYAYKRLQMPDGPLMIGTYAATACLAAAGGEDRASTAPLLPIATAAKAGYDTLTCLKLAQEEWAENHAFCEYGQVATGLDRIVRNLDSRSAAGVPQSARLNGSVACRSLLVRVTGSRARCHLSVGRGREQNALRRSPVGFEPCVEWCNRVITHWSAVVQRMVAPAPRCALRLR